VSPAVPPSLSRLLAARSESDRRFAWSLFVREHSRLIYSAARRRSPDRDDTMDRYTLILEELRKDDLRRLRAFDPSGASRFTTWLVVVCSRICIDHVRRKYGQKTGGDASPALVARRNLVDLAGPQPDALALASSDSAPDAPIRRRELEERVATVVDQLDPEDRLLIQLRFHDDLSARDIAATMGLPTPFHVYRRINALKVRLRGLLEHQGVVSAEP
jgi:RNA polymerase sigma factor (sigma-70 family)